MSEAEEEDRRSEQGSEGGVDSRFLFEGRTAVVCLTFSMCCLSVVEELQVQILKLLLNNKDKSTVRSPPFFCLKASVYRGVFIWLPEIVNVFSFLWTDSFPSQVLVKFSA